ncbi:hypothetical protein Enr13x_48710 [Stieleria neptunia]|uniref:Uncharacterized protein n=2 Tax=Stieleria neptunia TaxID=2527979 RepID=A0A518HVY0_9BACT|nr:hypothetical protein Enr13x_48710 [Stieleria neptunia]
MVERTVDQSDEPVTIIVIDASSCLMALDIDVDTATTLIALASEDPSNWDEAMTAWPRYRTPAVCEFVSSLPLEETGRGDAMNALSSSDAWVAIDFRDKRIFTGGQFDPVGRNAAFAMVVDESGNQHCPLSVHLPPWWELHEGVAAREVSGRRLSPIDKPHVDREVLYGDAFLTDIATRALTAVASGAWQESDAADDQTARDPLTIAVHRDWLMTPRDDLNGRMPRQLLHGAIGWSDHVTWGQRLRFEDGGPMVAAPCDWAGFETAPMGSQEMCLYFDLCREVIGATWHFLAEQRETSCEIEELIEFLRDVKDDWLHRPFEGGSPPSFILECDRRRVPRGAGVAIEGIDAVQSEQHLADCDCPICEMMAEGMFGVSFTSIDGHHLELDDEFAFSMIESRQAWETQQRENAEFHAEMDRQWAERKSSGETDDPFASVWSGINEDNLNPENSPFSGKLGGQLKMAFMVGEIVSDLETDQTTRDEIRNLNQAFADYRNSKDEQLALRASELKAVLESLADRYPILVSKSADLQSRIDEAMRGEQTNKGDRDLPF